jgi:hypothetical protein
MSAWRMKQFALGRRLYARSVGKSVSDIDVSMVAKPRRGVYTRNEANYFAALLVYDVQYHGQTRILIEEFGKCHSDAVSF